MDNSNNSNKTFDIDNRSPLKELNVKNNKPPEPCDNSNKNAHIFDMENSFLQNTVMIPTEFDSDQNSGPDGTNNSNQENQKPRYSILTTFEKETDEIKLLESCNENLLNANVLSKSDDFSKTFVNPINEDFVEKTVEVEVATQSSSAIELNRSSSANTSTQSENSGFNNTVILNKSLTVENITPDQSLVDANKSSTVKQSDSSLTNLSNSNLNNEQNFNTADQTFVHSSSKTSLNLCTTLKQSDISVTNSAGSNINTSEQSFVDGNLASFNESSTLKPDVSFGNSSNITEQNYYTASENNVSVDGSNKSLDVSFTPTQKLEEETTIIKNQDNKTGIDHLKFKVDEPAPVNDSFINAFTNKLILNSPVVSEKTEIKVNVSKVENKDFTTSEEILNEVEIAVNETTIKNKDDLTVDLENKYEIISAEVHGKSEIPLEISVESVKIVNDLNKTYISSDKKISLIPDEISVESVKIVNDNKINISLDEKVSVPETVTNKNISFEINTKNLQGNEKLSETVNKEDVKEYSAPETVTNKNISFEINTKNLQVNEIFSETVNKEDIKEYSAPETVSNNNISFEINTKNLQVNEILSETVNKEDIEEYSLENKNVSFEIINTSQQIVDAPVEYNKEEIIEATCPTQSLNNTYENKSVIDTVTNKNISFDINTKNLQVNEVLNETVNKEDIKEYSAPETVSNNNISFEINTKNLQVNEILSETVNKEDIEVFSFENKNVSFEVINTDLQIVDAPVEDNKEEIIEVNCSTQSLNNTYENKSVIDTVENINSSSTPLTEETHMSTSESNSGVNEPTVANKLTVETNAACTNEMGEIINPNECFEKQLDVTNGAIDNKESLEAKTRVYNEMAEKYASVEAECEKFKVQVADLKKELKSCRQKSVTLEAEVADLKRRENELNLLLEEYKQSTANKGDAKEEDEQLKRLQASEEALKNEVKELTALVNQHESRLKELQRKEVKLEDDLTSKTQSEMQISRVMEEYEKSLSSLISDNEKMKKERDTAQMHLANIEMAFSDVHQKYERCKSIVQGYKDNEESYKQDIAMNRETIVIQEQKYESLKAHAMKQLEISNQELATMKKQHETEMARLTAQLKRYEIKTQSLMESLQQKAKECEQLSAVCDEFIGNV